ncbi:signal peptide peptidase-domain-containing protein [Irpex rosettiformis]|uniref:Signal peptide peptidase-domain-containing protein n=1 Tax=Irpex rosettiformis TaxID=378272 RepID=A0ACB8U178_9APHY|nr:signal peptide peptidase-domain-containing protein [Irpex rosettiformis]
MTDTSVDWDLLSSYAGLLSLATFSIYAGAFGSLPPVKHKPKEGEVAEGDEEEEEQAERLSSEDAWLFPIIGSALLLGLYLVVKYFGEEWINWALQWYFTIAGIGSGGKALISLVRWAVGPRVWKRYDRITIKIVKGSQGLMKWTIRTPSLYLIPLGALPSILYNFGGSQTRRSALLTDILALSFSFNALSFLTIDSFKTGSILLSGLFLYDIWWVFGTEVMVKVATTLDVPIKLLWPKSMSFSTHRGFTMLGLGDIVIPGMFVALALRYDQHKASHLGNPGNSWSKPYFYASLGAYVLGLSTTMGIMHFFRAAQPALLYLSPACIMSFVLTATIRGELAEAWKWVEESEQTESDKQPANGRTSHDPEVNGKAKTTALPSEEEDELHKRKVS